MAFDFRFGLAMSGSPMAASTTDRASRFGSVGFFEAFFFGFGIPHGARAVQLSLDPHDSNFTPSRPVFVADVTTSAE